MEMWDWRILTLAEASLRFTIKNLSTSIPGIAVFSLVSMLIEARIKIDNHQCLPQTCQITHLAWISSSLRFFSLLNPMHLFFVALLVWSAPMHLASGNQECRKWHKWGFKSSLYVFFWSLIPVVSMEGSGVVSRCGLMDTRTCLSKIGLNCVGVQQHVCPLLLKSQSRKWQKIKWSESLKCHIMQRTHFEWNLTHALWCLGSIPQGWNVRFHCLNLHEVFQSGPAEWDLSFLALIYIHHW